METKIQRRLATARRACSAADTTMAAGILALAVLLGGCSSVRLVDSDVTAFAAPAASSVVVPVTYRFERLPSQQAQGQARSALEALAEPELARVGLQRNDSAPQTSVQLDVRTYRDPQPPWDDARYTTGYIAPYPVATRFGTVWRYPSLTMRFDVPYYRREVHIVVRRLADNQVVFESRANHDGPWPDDEAVLPAMFRAALQGFPDPPPGLRRVVVEIAR